jgi:antitoxin ParD1/3/4
LYPPRSKKDRFAPASEAMRAGLRLLEEQEVKVEQLRNAITKGEESGTPVPFDMRVFIASKLKSPPPKAGFPPSRE